MAGEIVGRLTLALNAGPISISINRSISVDQTNADITAADTLLTDPADQPLTGTGGTDMGWIFLTNLSTTSVQYGPEIGGSMQQLCRLAPGDAHMFRMEDSVTIAAQSLESGEAQIEYIIFDK